MKQSDSAKNDYLLVKCALNGDEQARNQLYTQSNRIITGFTKKYTRNFKTGYMSYDDIVGEAYLRAFSRLKDFQGRSQFSSWVCAFVKRITWNEHSKTMRRDRIYGQHIVPYSKTTSRNPSEIYFEKELSNSLWEALYKLPPLESYILENHIVNTQTFFNLGKAILMTPHRVKQTYDQALCKYSENFHRIHHGKKL